MVSYSMLRYFKVFAGLFIAFSMSAQDLVPQEVGDSIAELRLGEVTVTGQSARQRMRIGMVGVERLELEKLASTPAMFGENDIIKSMTLMPGVHGEGEGGGGFEVRGGTSAQNLVMLDGATLYNATHVMGIFSTFNDNALGRATLYKGPFPSYFGGATASVLETSLAPGDMESYHASGTVGILAAKVKAEGPIVKDCLSLAVTARRSYVDAFLQMVPKFRDTEMNFYDITAKMRWQPRRGQLVDVSFIASRDNMGITDLMDMRWGNIAGSVSWSAALGDRWRFSTVGAVTDYTTKMGMEMMDMRQTVREYIRNFSLNERARFLISDGHSLELGLRSELLRVRSGEFSLNGRMECDERSAWENAVWADYTGCVGRMEISGGMRLGMVSALGWRDFHRFEALGEVAPDFSGRTYLLPEPRINVKYDISELHNVKGAVGWTSQNIHAIRSSATSFPFDRFALTSASVAPERAVQYGVAYAGMTGDGVLDWSVEGYFKDIHNVYDYRDGSTMFSRVNLESIILGGCGRSYGLELMVRKNIGRLTGWVSYTLSKTLTRIDGINGGEWYDATNDRRHVASVVAMYALSRRWNLSASWTYSSGNPLTAPDSKYELDGATCYYYSRRNGYRTPASHRLDLSATYTHVGERFTYRWAIGVYNAYCHYSPFVIYFEDDDTKPSGTRCVQQSLYGVIPSVSYTLKF